MRFAGKIRAAKDTQRDSDFIVIARTEALIAGWGVEEALMRAAMYVEAGADAVVAHSRKTNADEVFAFSDRAMLGVPLVSIPTNFPSVSTQTFQRHGIHNLIFANQGLRTVITALQKNLALLRQTTDLMSLEDEIVPVSEIFRIQQMDELDAAEDLYLPQAERSRGLLVSG